MNQKLCPTEIDFSLIDFTDRTYSLYPDQEIILDEAFRQSVARSGVLHPPILRETPSGAHVIVAGRKRLLAIQALFPAKNSCCCLLLHRQLPETDVYSILLEETSISRQLTPIEKGFFLRKISAFMDVEDIARIFLPRLDLPGDPRYIRQILMLLDLDDPLIQAVHHGQINETVARDIASFPVDDRMMVCEIITTLQLSYSNQKKLVKLCRELAGRQNISITELLQDDEVHTILNHPDANPPQKAKNLMKCLGRNYMPRNSLAETEFSRFAAALRLPPNVSVAHSLSFEDDAVTLTIKMPNRKTVQNVWEKISHALQDQKN